MCSKCTHKTQVNNGLYLKSFSQRNFMRLYKVLILIHKNKTIKLVYNKTEQEITFIQGKNIAIEEETKRQTDDSLPKFFTE